MKEIVIGLIAGIVGGLGMGGGTVLILLLSIISNVEQHIAQATNVIFFVPMSIAAIFTFIKNKNIKFKLAIPISLLGIVGASIGAIIAINLDMQVLRKVFGAFLILIVIYQSYYLYKRYRKPKNRNTSTKQYKGGKI